MTGSNNNNPGNPGVPPDRFNELLERVRRSEEQNQQLRGQIDVLTRQTMPNQKQQAPRQSKFSPDVQMAIEEEIKARVTEIVQPLQEQFQNQSGYMMEQLDAVNFQTQYGSKPTYAKYVDKVEQVRKDAQMRGQWLSREQALQYVYFQETGKKPAPENTQEAAPKAPQFDTFLGQYVDAQGQPVAPPQLPTIDQLQPQAQQPQQQQPAQAQPQFQQQAPAAPAQQQMQNQGFDENGGHAFTPQLPNMNTLPQTPRVPAGQHFGVDVTSDEKALQAWEQKYGDITF